MWMGCSSALEALIAKKRAIKQAAMQQLLAGETRLPGFSGDVGDDNARRSCGYKEWSHSKHSNWCLLERADSVVYTDRRHSHAGEVSLCDGEECHCGGIGQLRGKPASCWCASPMQPRNHRRDQDCYIASMHKPRLQVARL